MHQTHCIEIFYITYSILYIIEQLALTGKKQTLYTCMVICLFGNVFLAVIPRIIKNREGQLCANFNTEWNRAENNGCRIEKDRRNLDLSLKFQVLIR